MFVCVGVCVGVGMWVGACVIAHEKNKTGSVFIPASVSKGYILYEALVYRLTSFTARLYEIRILYSAIIS